MRLETPETNARFSGGTERRSRVRVPVKCTVLLVRSRGAAPIRAQTVNISPDGFYCLANQSLVAGEILSCDLHLHLTRRDGPKVTLHCTVEVLRVEERYQGYGLAFRIQDYSVADYTPGITWLRSTSQLQE